MAKASNVKAFKHYDQQEKDRKAEIAKHGDINEVRNRKLIAVIPAQPGYKLTVAAVVSSNWSNTEMCFGTGKAIAWGFDAAGKAHALTDNGTEAWFVNNGCFYKSIVTTEDGMDLYTHGHSSLDQWKRNTVSQCEHDLGTKIFVHPCEDYPHEPGTSGFEDDGADIADEFTAKRTKVRKALELVANTIKPVDVGFSTAAAILHRHSKHGQLRLAQLDPVKFSAVLVACKQAIAEKTISVNSRTSQPMRTTSHDHARHKTSRPQRSRLSALQACFRAVLAPTRK